MTSHEVTERSHDVTLLCIVLNNTYPGNAVCVCASETYQPTCTLSFGYNCHCITKLSLFIALPWDRQVSWYLVSGYHGRGIDLVPYFTGRGSQCIVHFVGTLYQVTVKKGLGMYVHCHFMAPALIAVY